MRSTHVFATMAMSAAVTLLAASVPRLGLAYRAPELPIAFATAALLIALLTGFLVAARFMRRPCLNELILLCSVEAFGLSELPFIALPALPGPGWRAVAIWSALGGISFCGGLFALAAFVTGRRMLRPVSALAVGAAVVIAGLATTVAIVSSYSTALADTPGAGSGLSLLSRPDPAANIAMLTLQLVLTAIYGLAVVGFVRRFVRRRDEFSGWLAIAAVLAAAGSVNYLLLPTPDFHYVSLGDVFRLCFIVALLIGSAREMSSHWRTLTADSALEERQRIAYDLHDGLAQELAYLLRNLDAGDGVLDGETTGRLRGAAERAQADVRETISALSVAGRQPVDAAVVLAVGEVAARDRVKVELDVLPGMRLPAARVEAVTRIACEAVGNAARHGGAEQVRLSLRRRGTRVRLRVSDNGKGFDVAAPCEGFGLTSMRERALSVGGDLRISSERGRGTEVEALL